MRIQPWFKCVNLVCVSEFQRIKAALQKVLLPQLFNLVTGTSSVIVLLERKPGRRSLTLSTFLILARGHIARGDANS